MKLNSYSFGEETGTPLVIVHGLFGSARNWHSLARNLARERWVVSVDLRNHGQSGWSESNTYPDLASDLGETIDGLGGRATVLGHSMGGKAAMMLAATAPEKIDRLIIADIAPVTYAHDQTDNIEIMKALPLDEITRRSEAQIWLETKTEDPALAAFFSQGLELQDGKAHWLLNHDALATHMADIVGFPEVDFHFDKPTLAIRGGASDYVDEKGQEALKQRFSQLTIETIPQAGHWLHAEKPKEFLSIVKEFIE
ncbi:alpha/beta fold hydrolase [Neptunicoccus cionae]|uniref:alpha/beta fold hydrolase n=1 Tax=Neptunicoccus cionae TaxID=2035344 RepID=UPI000C77769D|nr:alpha/beta fold hydrolase [Amylibacter cionae]PLS22872.1 alpha/beta hydrolase [Amylibacter cionae]